MSDHEFDHEPVPGLPEQLPAGERMLWQGAPAWRSLAVHAFRIRGLSLYFLALIVWRAHSSWNGSLSDTLAAVTPVLVLSILALGLLAGLGWAMARSTLYTITNRRVVIRAGVAIPITINIPFSVVESAALRTHSDATGDLPLVLSDRSQVSYVVMWPHVRPWSMGHTQPMLRAIREPAQVAGILADALAGALAQSTGAAPANPSRQQRSEGPSGSAVGGLTTAAA